MSMFPLRLLLSRLFDTLKKKASKALDELVEDYLDEQKKAHERKLKLAELENANSDNEEDTKFAKCLDKMSQLTLIEEDVSVCDILVFGPEKVFPLFDICDLSSCSLVNHQANSLEELTTESGETFFEGLLTNGKLLELVRMRGEVEEGDSSPLEINWLPSYSELSDAFDTYGFLLHSPVKASSEMISLDSEPVGPSQNIRAWIKFVIACSTTRLGYTKPKSRSKAAGPTLSPNNNKNTGPIIIIITT
ncbi:hypothetical protein Tco_1399977 [Tanacetum coccineum]